jgi:hypothetical protein
MAVMDADTGKLLNYRQLMRSTKYREAWSLSSANEFGRLANGIGPTTDTMQHTLQLVDYLATQEDAVLSYHASDMVLAVHSNASYLSEPKA